MNVESQDRSASIGPDPARPELTAESMRTLVRRAADAIDAILRGVALASPSDLPPELLRRQGVFVTVRRGSTLAGCIGIVGGRESLWEDVASMAVAAAFDDPRFDPVVASDRSRIELEVSVLSTPVGATFQSFEPGRDGLILCTPDGSGLLLPQVATEHGLDREAFLDVLCRKAGLEPGSWRSAADHDWSLESFTVQTRASRFLDALERSEPPTGERT